MTKPFRTERREASREDRRPDPRPAAEIPCGRCCCRYASLGALEAHLLYEHGLIPGQAHGEALEAMTGGSVDPDTQRCRGCGRLAEDPHTLGCPYVQTRGLPMAAVAPPRTPERQFYVRWCAHLPVAQHAEFLADLARLLTVVQARERESV